MDTPAKLKAKDAELINEGSILSESIKQKGERLSQIKVLLEHLPKGNYRTTEGRALQVTEVDQFTPIDPREVQELLTAKKLGKYFVNCVSVVIKELSKYLGDTDINTLRTKKSEPQRRYSFK